PCSGQRLLILRPENLRIAQLDSVGETSWQRGQKLTKACDERPGITGIAVAQRRKLKQHRAQLRSKTFDEGFEHGFPSEQRIEEYRLHPALFRAWRIGSGRQAHVGFHDEAESVRDLGGLLGK